MIKIKFSSSFVAVSSRSMEKPCDSNKQFTQAIRFLINFCYLRFVNTLFHSYSPLMSKVPDKKKLQLTHYHVCLIIHNKRFLRNTLRGERDWRSASEPRFPACSS